MPSPRLYPSSFILHPAAAILFLLLPGHALAYIGGLPWGPLGLACAVLVGLGIFASWPIRPSRWLKLIGLATLALAALKVAFALSAPRYGLEASYYANETFSNEPESSTAAPGTPYTRLDPAFDFGSDEFPLYFFNDNERFQSLGPDRLDRGKSLTWSARWVGSLNVPDDRQVIIWLTASGPGELHLDGRRLLRVNADGRATDQAELQLTRGPHALEVRYVRRKERSPLLRIETDLAGRREILEAPLIAADPHTPQRLALDSIVTTAARAVDLAFLALLVSGLALALAARLARPSNLASPAASPSFILHPSTFSRLERPLLALIPLGFFIQATLPRLSRFGKMVFLAGGQDWLTHETLARDIQFNGPLMALGKPLGQGALYYAQPLYPYYLAILHTLAGEDYFGVQALQVLGLGVAVVLVYYLARRLFGLATALVTLALLLGVLVPFELAWVARLLISEALYFWLMPAAVLALLAVARIGQVSPPPPPEPGRGGEGLPLSHPRTLPLSVAAGLLLGLACVTRGPTLLYLPPAGLLLWRLLRRDLAPRQAARTLAVVGLGAALVVGLVPLRNLIVAGKPALTASSGGVNLEKFHRPSDNVRLSGIDDHPLYDALGLDRPTREVVEYARQDPLGYLASYLPLAAYTLGVGSAMNDLLDEEPVQLQPELLALNLLYVLALLLVPRARTLEAGLLHAFIAVHFLTMVVFTPYDYENRLVQPMYLFVTPFAAAVLVRLGALVQSRVAAAQPAVGIRPRVTS